MVADMAAGHIIQFQIADADRDIIAQEASRPPADFARSEQFQGFIAVQQDKVISEPFLKQVAELFPAAVFDIEGNRSLFQCRPAFEHPDQFDPRQYLKPARIALRDMVRHKIVNVMGCNGKA